MALTSILVPIGNKAVFFFNRGNIGVLVDTTSHSKVMLTIPGGGGSCTYPSQNDVRYGVTFGSIYTGNLELPIASNVRTGIQYGTNGIEYVGTFIGGVETSYVF